MGKSGIAEGLRDKRQELKISVREVAEYLAREGKIVSVKTIYGWEKAYSQPDADTLMLLCRFYGITNVLAEFGYEEPEQQGSTITKTEKQLLREYRRQKKMQPAINKLLDLDVEEDRDAHGNS